MNSLLLLAPIAGVGIGTVAAYGATHSDLSKRLHFVQRENLESELDDIGVDLGAAETCVECGDEIDPSEIGAVVRIEGEYKVVCDDPECLDTYDVQ